MVVKHCFKDQLFNNQIVIYYDYFFFHAKAIQVELKLNLT